MKMRVIGVNQEELKRRAPEILQKAARAMDVVLVEKEPTFDDKINLPHTQDLVAQLEDWYYGKMSRSLDTVKNALIQSIAGKDFRKVGVVNQSRIVPKNVKEGVKLQKSRIALIHMKNLLRNPSLDGISRVNIYNSARQIMSVANADEKADMIDIFLEIRDLVNG